MRVHWLLAGFLLMFAGCGVGSLFGDKELEFGGTCNVSPDQMGTFMAPAKTFPLRVIADRAFDASEYDAIITQIARWNALGHEIAGHDFFRVSQNAIPDSIRGVNPKDCGNSYANDTLIYIVKITDMSRWTSLGFTSSIPGATVRCAGGYDLDQQIILINPGTDQAPLIDPQQFGSVIVHELGHALGLDHSCLDPSGRPDYRGCSGLPDDHDYRVAVMYPRLSRGVSSGLSSPVSPEIKETLRNNDKIRAQCLYSPK